MEHDQQRGPVMEADLQALRQSGAIQDDTLVWKEGMAQWTRYADALRPGASASAPPPAAAAPGPSSQVTCSQCGGTFPASEVMRYGGAAVCASCKPAFVQKLREGSVAPAGPMAYASFGSRFGAYLLDSIIVGVLGAIVGGIFGAIVGATSGSRSGSGTGAAVLLFAAGNLLGLAIQISYYVYFIGKSGQTPGKKLCKVRVVNADGSQVSYGKAAGRFFGYFVSSIILCFGFFMAAWDPEKRALHDRMCNTRVIKAQ